MSYVQKFDIISLSKAVRVLENNTIHTTTFLSKYIKRTDHLDKSLHQYFHIIKNNLLNQNKKEYIPHYVGGGGQPTHPISINFARTEMIKHIPWQKNNPLPTLMTETNYIALFRKFQKSEYCPTSVSISITVSISIKRAEIELKTTKKDSKNLYQR